MVKKIISSILALSLCTTVCPITGLAEVSDEANNITVIDALNSFGDKAQNVLSMNFEKNSLEFENKATKENSKQVDAEHGTSYAFPTGGAVSQYKTLEEPIKKGIVLIDYDLYLSSSGCLTYARLANSAFTGVNVDNDPNMAETMGVNVAGQAGYYPSSTGWTLMALKKMPMGEWVDMSIWLELDAGKIYFSLNNEFIGEAGIKKEEIYDLQTIIFSYDNRTGSGGYLDNVNVVKIDRTIMSELNAMGVDVPDALLATASVSAKVGEKGNAVYEKNKSVPAVISVTNKLNIEQPVVLNVTAKSREGKKLFEDSVDIKLEPEKTSDIEITLPPLTEYGFYDLYFDVYGKDDNELKCSDFCEYALVNLPPEGTRNPKIGIINHERHVRMGDPTVNLEFIAKAGFSSARSEVSWDRYETEPGNYKLPAKYEQEMKDRAKYNIDHLEILGYSNYSVTPEFPPISKEAIKVFGDFSLNLIKDIKEVRGDGTIEVEMWNEYNNSDGRFGSGATPETYAKMINDLYPRIKAQYPDVKAWAMGTIGVPVDWIERVLKAGAANSFDGISVHPYSFTQAPENGGMIEKVLELKEVVAKYRQDVAYRGTEWGWTSNGRNGYPDRAHQAAYFVRMGILNEKYDLFERVDWYTINDGGENLDHPEYNFGLLRGPEAKIPYGVKPSYLAATNYNKLMTNAKYVESYEWGEDVDAHKFVLADGRTCIAAWKVNDGTQISAVNLGTDTLTMMDMYGNETTLNAMDNAFHISFNELPVYLIGDFTTAEEKDEMFALESSELEIPSGDASSYLFYQYSNTKGRIEIVGNDDISLKENPGFKGDVARLIFASEGKEVKENDEVGCFGNVRINVYDMSDKLVFTQELDVKYIDKVEIDIKAKPHDTKNSNWWQLIASVSNRSMSEDIDVVLDIALPEKISKNVGDLSMYVGANSSRQIKINIPDYMAKTKNISLKADVNFAGGEKVVFNKEYSLQSSVAVEKKPIIDGKLAAGEWDESSAILPSEGNYVYLAGDSYGGADDLSGTIYTAWDEEYFYMAAKVKDNVLSDDKATASFYRGDGIQIAFAPYRGSGQISQLDFAQIKGENRLTIERNPIAERIGEVNAEDFEFELGRENNITTYEMCVPWSVIFPNGYRAQKNGELALTLLINDNDGSVREGYYEYGSGMGSGTPNSELYHSFYMLGKSLFEELK